jgi:hypothetical protein
MAKLNDYLFIDKARVDSYFEQVESTPKLVKLPAWKVAFGLTGPSVEGTQSTAIQTFSVHEKVTTLMSKLDPYRGEPSTFDGEDGDFIFETMTATRAFLPPGTSKRQDFPGVAIWLGTRASVESSLQGFRYLVEDFQQDDENRMRSSGYSVVRAIFMELENELRDTSFRTFAEHEELTTIVKVPSPTLHHLNTTYIDTFRNAHSSFATESEAYYSDKEQTLRQILSLGGIHDYDNSAAKYRGVNSRKGQGEIHFFDIFLGDQIHSVEVTRNIGTDSDGVAKIKRDRWYELEKRLVHEPARMLQELGAIISPPRKIDCLYRIRRSGESTGGLTIIGYPIFISASPSAFSQE